MRAANYLKKFEYVTTEDDLKKTLGFANDDTDPLYIWEMYRNGGMTIYKWRCGDFWGFLRDDSSGWSGCTVFESHDDEEWLAAQNADYDVKEALKRRGDGIDWKYILKIAQEWQWGFNGNTSIYTEA